MNSLFLEKYGGKQVNNQRIKIKASDGYTYSAFVKDNSPIFYNKRRTKK